MLVVGYLYTRMEKSYEEYKSRRLNSNVMQIRAKNGDITRKEADEVRKESEEYYDAYLLVSFLFFVLIVLWIWAVVMILKYINYMTSIELLVMFLMLFFLGLSPVVLLYMYIIVKPRSVAGTAILNSGEYLGTGGRPAKYSTVPQWQQMSTY